MRETRSSRLLKVTTNGSRRSFLLLAISLWFLIFAGTFLFEPEIRVRAAGESVGAVLRGRPRLSERTAHRVPPLHVSSTDDLWQTSDRRPEQTAGVEPKAEAESGSTDRTQLHATLTLDEVAQR